MDSFGTSYRREYDLNNWLDHFIEYIAKGAVQGGYLEYAEELRTFYDADIDWIAGNAAQSGYFEFAERL